MTPLFLNFPCFQQQQQHQKRINRKKNKSPEICISNFGLTKPFGCRKQFCLLQLPICYCVSLIMVTITRRIFTNIFKLEHISAVNLNFPWVMRKMWTFFWFQKAWGEKRSRLLFYMGLLNGQISCQMERSFNVCKVGWFTIKKNNNLQKQWTNNHAKKSIPWD